MEVIWKVIVKHVKENSKNSATKMFKVDPKSFHEWVKNDSKLVAMKRSRSRLDGAGQKLTHVELKEHGLS